MLVFDCMGGFTVPVKAKLACSCWAMSRWREIVHCVGILDGQISCMFCIMMMGIILLVHSYSNLALHN